MIELRILFPILSFLAADSETLTRLDMYPDVAGGTPFGIGDALRGDSNAPADASQERDGAAWEGLFCWFSSDPWLYRGPLSGSGQHGCSDLGDPIALGILGILVEGAFWLADVVSCGTCSTAFL